MHVFDSCYVHLLYAVLKILGLDPFSTALTTVCVVCVVRVCMSVCVVLCGAVWCCVMLCGAVR